MTAKMHNDRNASDPPWLAEWIASDNVCQPVRGGIPVRDEPRATAAGAASRVLLSGSFNPWHQGHAQMQAIAERILQRPVDLELSVQNVDKPNLTARELAKRLAQFDSRQVIWVTKAPTFVEKTRLFPTVTFVVGADTLARLVAVEYYSGQVAARDRAIGWLCNVGSQFLVVGRRIEGRFVELDHLELPGELRAICRGVPESRFREDVSSSQLRKESANDARTI